MALELRQQLKLTQQLIMTPQLQMAIKLLQLSRLELMDTITQELQENPALELSEPGPADAPEGASAAASADWLTITQTQKCRSVCRANAFSVRGNQSRSR